MRRLGKFHPSLLERLVYQRLGAVRSEVLVGPRFGVDNAVVRIDGGRVMVTTTDPISFIPALGPEDSAWLSVHSLASDLTTSGFPPMYATLDFNLPPEMKDSQFRRYWLSVESELRLLGAMIIAGHTGRFEGCDYTVIGGGTLISIGGEERYLSSHMSRVGDSIVVTKSAALSSAAILSRVFPNTVEQQLGVGGQRKAQRLFRKVSTVSDALTVASLGVREAGVSAMHDATEGGVFAALYEMLIASGVGGVIEEELIPVAPDVQDVCDLFSLDPYTALSEGSLIVSCPPKRVQEALDALKRVGVSAAEVGKVLQRGRGIRLRARGRERQLSYPKSDPYWRAYWKGIRNGWD